MLLCSYASKPYICKCKTDKSIIFSQCVLTNLWSLQKYIPPKLRWTSWERWGMVLAIILSPDRLHRCAGPDNRSQLSELSLAKRSKLFWAGLPPQLLTSLCRICPQPRPLHLNARRRKIVQRFRCRFCRTSGAANILVLLQLLLLMLVLVLVVVVLILSPGIRGSLAVVCSPFHFILHILLWLPLARQLIHFLLLCLLISMWQIYPRNHHIHQIQQHH